MTALTVDVVRVFTAVVVVVAFVTIAVMLATWTPAADDNDGTDDTEGWPRVPDEQMRIIDATLPADQMDAKRAQLIEEGVAQ